MNADERMVAFVREYEALKAKYNIRLSVSEWARFCTGDDGKDPVDGYAEYHLSEDPDPVTHYLKEGRALCRFNKKEPGRWPPEHSWVRPPDSALATCAKCLALKKGPPS